MRNKNVDGKKGYGHNGNYLVQLQDQGELIHDHTEQAGQEGDPNDTKQQKTFCSEAVPVLQCMNDAEQEKQGGGQFMNVHSGDRDQNGEY